MSAPKDCSGIENDLALFVGGELDSPARARVEQHLLGCPSCAGAVERLAASRAALRAGLERSGARVPDLWPGVRARLVESGTLRPPLTIPARSLPAAPQRGMPRWIPISAAAAALFALGLWMMQQGDEQPSVHPIARNAQPIPVQLVGLRRLAPGESALSLTATPIEALQEEEAHQHASLQRPGGAQAASQHRGIH
jgi:anti-sigma factor RsiW